MDIFWSVLFARFHDTLMNLISSSYLMENYILNYVDGMLKFYRCNLFIPPILIYVFYWFENHQVLIDSR